MIELIRREDALDALSEQIVMSMCLTVEECKARRSMRYVDQELIKLVPAVDAAEVVRCKDCYRSYRDPRGERYCSHLRSRWNRDSGFLVDDDSFCAWGIRKENTDEHD